MYYAHSTEDEFRRNWQPLRQHLEETVARKIACDSAQHHMRAHAAPSRRPSDDHLAHGFGGAISACRVGQFGRLDPCP